ncbi:MAG: hypothetical protein GWP61_04065 [Chloroflexi bacterium]|nr:hypothetical protein [Chloroflexota bacterium]
MRNVRFVFIGLFVLSLFVLSSGAPAEASTPIDVGYLDFQYPSSLGNKEVTAEKPESKLWWNDGFWWASMWSSSGNAYHIFKLNWSTQDWVDTGTALDDRTDSKADVLWDGTKLYVVSHIWAGSAGSASAGDRGELFRYSYDSGTKSYALDSGFPVEVNQAKSEALVIDKDSTGVLWVTYVQNKKVYVNHSVLGDDSSWGTPYVLPVGSDADVKDDDLSSIVAYDGRIGVMWSSQTSGNKIYFASHVDGAGDTAADWTSIGAYTTSGDDHINVKSLSSDGAGSVFAAVKTSRSAALLLLLVCNSGTACTSASNWSAHTVYTGSTKSPTRPIVLLDTSNRDIYYFARVDDNIYYKRSDMDSISFPSGDGDPFIKSSSYNGINDPTSTKQNVDSTTGLVVMASDSNARYYLHNCIRLAGGNSSQCLTGNPTPSAYFSNTNFSVNEAGAPTAEVIVKLSQSMPSTVTVNYTMQNGSATDGIDYSASNGTLTFVAGDTAESIFVPILDDSSPESDETVTLTLSSASGVDLGAPNTATLTIVDDDTPPEIAFGSATYSIAENVGLATITVTLSRSYSQNVTVSLATTGGTATAGIDYTAIPPTTLTFNPYQISQQINVSITNDTLKEVDETVLLTLSNPSANASLGTPSTATLTIFDNELPSVYFSSATYSGSESGGSVTVTVQLDVPSTEAISVNYATSDNTAQYDTDYEAQSGKLTFPPNSTSQTFQIPIINNELPEASEQFNVTLSNPDKAVLGTPVVATVTILDDDKSPTIALDATNYDVDENGGSVQVTVNLSEKSGATVAVTYATSAGTAHSGSDYTHENKVLTFAPGETSASIKLSILDDTLKEGNEAFTLTLSNPDKGTLGTPDQATITIVDDEPFVSLKETSYTVGENQGVVTFTAELNREFDEQITVYYATVDGTANAGEDYDSASGQLIFFPTETSKNFTVNIVNDSENEQDEMFSLNLTDTTIAPSSTVAKAKVTISDDDRPTVQLGDSSYTAYGVGSVTIEVLLNTPAAATATVKFKTSDGSAADGSDYTAVQGTLIFEPGSTSQTFTIPILVSNSDPTEKTINITLSDSYKADLGLRDTAVLKISERATLFLPALRG